MPVYDIKCTKCGHKTFDVFYTYPTDKVKQKCGCGSTEFEKIPSRVAVRFNGEGWSKPTTKEEED